MINMNSKTIDALDAMARRYIDGTVTRTEIFELPLFDMWYVLTMASAYSCTLVGTISQRECVKLRYKVASDYKLFFTRLSFDTIEHDNWITATKKYSLKESELTRELKKDEPDAVFFISGLCELIDLLTREHVLHKLLVKRLQDENFLKACQTAVLEHGDEWCERFEHIRDEDYMILLERFYAATDESGLATAFAALGADKLRDDARRQIPIKQDDTSGVADGIVRVYDERSFLQKL